MLDEILITVKDNGEVYAENHVLTMQNENDSKGFVVTIPEKISTYSIYIEFEKPNEETKTSERLSVVERTVRYGLGKDILEYAGVLKVQFVARQENGVTWKSDTANFIVKKSINATEKIIDVSGDLVADLQAQLDGKQDLLIAGRNIELKRQGKQVLISVPETSSGLTEDEVQEKIEENLVGIDQEVELAKETAIEAKKISVEAKNTVDSVKTQLTATGALANEANENSKNALENSNQANSTANSAIEIAEEAKRLADNIDEVASNALSVASNTLSYATEAKTVATQTQANFETFKEETNKSIVELEQTVNVEIAEAIETEKTERTNAINALDTALNEKIKEVEQTHETDKNDLKADIKSLQNGKLDKVTTTHSYPRLYSINNDGTQAVITASVGALKNTLSVVLRDDNGRTYTEIPIEDKQTANKKYVDSTITQKIAETVANAPESFDTLEEIAKWIEEHPESVAELNALIQANKTAIEESKVEIEELQQHNQDFSLENGEALGSIQQVLYEDDTRKGSNAHGKYGVALNQNTNSYQRCSTSTGLATQAGLTYEEFIAKYPDGVDEHGYDYEKSNSAAFSSGQETKSRGRGAFTGGGYKNEVDGDYSGSLGGGGNKVKGEYSGTVGGYGNEITEEASKSSVLDGYGNKISGENSGAGGSNNVVEVDNSHAFGTGLVLDKDHGHNKTVVGKYNDKNSYAIYQVGAGTSDEDRKNAFEVFEDGTAKANRFASKKIEATKNVRVYDESSGIDVQIFSTLIRISGTVIQTDYTNDYIQYWDTVNDPVKLYFPNDESGTFATREWVDGNYVRDSDFKNGTFKSEIKVVNTNNEDAYYSSVNYLGLEIYDIRSDTENPKETYYHADYIAYRQSGGSSIQFLTFPELTNKTGNMLTETIATQQFVEEKAISLIETNTPKYYEYVVELTKPKTAETFTDARVCFSFTSSRNVSSFADYGWTDDTTTDFYYNLVTLIRRALLGGYKAEDITKEIPATGQYVTGLYEEAPGVLAKVLCFAKTITLTHNGSTIGMEGGMIATVDLSAIGFIGGSVIPGDGWTDDFSFGIGSGADNTTTARVYKRPLKD